MAPLLFSASIGRPRYLCIGHAHFRARATDAEFMNGFLPPPRVLITAVVDVMTESLLPINDFSKRRQW